MAEAENDLVSLFSSVTGADAPTAQHVLEAHGWDLNNSVNFFLEQSGAAIPAPRAIQEHPVPYPDDDDDDEDYEPEEPARPVPPTRIELPDSPVQGSPPAAGHRSGVRFGMNGADDELQQALAASARETGVSRTGYDADVTHFMGRLVT